MTKTVTGGGDNLLWYVPFRRRRRQLAVGVGQALDFGDVGVVLPLPPVRARPLAFPVLGIDERPFVLELRAVFKQANPLDNPELVADRQAVVDDVLVDGHVARIDDERVAFPASAGFAA